MNEIERRQALADFLRTRRARLTPGDVGLPAGLRRRTPGLRREEVAQLANIGISWYVSLEQARNVRPSEQVLESLALALQLTPIERRHLFLLALQYVPVSQPSTTEQASPALQQIVQTLDPHPAYLIDYRWDLLNWNRAAELVFHFTHTPEPYPRNLIWRFFADPALRARNVNWERPARGLVAQLRADSARYPDDRAFATLINDLQQVSVEFCVWWSQHDVLSIPDCHKVMEHPSLGHLQFEMVTLQVSTTPSLKIVVYTACPTTAVMLAASIQPMSHVPTNEERAKLDKGALVS